MPAWKGSARMSVNTRTAPMSSPCDPGRYALGLAAFVFGCSRTGSCGEEEKGASGSTLVTVTGRPPWLTAEAFWFGMPQPTMVATKSTVGGVRKKQLESPAPTRSTDIEG